MVSSSFFLIHDPIFGGKHYSTSDPPTWYQIKIGFYTGIRIEICLKPMFDFLARFAQSQESDRKFLSTYVASLISFPDTQHK